MARAGAASPACRDARSIARDAEALGFETPPLVQECIDGEDYCVPRARARRRDQGDAWPIATSRRFPREAGAGAVRETVDAEPFMETAAKLVASDQLGRRRAARFPLDGEQANAKLIEVNARFWAGIFHSMESGVDFPWLLYRQTIGEEVEQSQDAAESAPPRKPQAHGCSPPSRTSPRPIRISMRRPKRGPTRKPISSPARAVKAMEEAAQAPSANHSRSARRRTNSGVRFAISKMRPSELTAAKDPLVGLGALFVLSSLVRQGSLPPEVTYKAEETRTRTARARGAQASGDRHHQAGRWRHAALVGDEIRGVARGRRRR